MPKGAPADPRNVSNQARLVIWGALIAAIAALGGALIGSHATLTTQRDQAREFRLAEARAKRAAVYTTFLGRARTFAHRTQLAYAAKQNSDGRSIDEAFGACLDAGDILGDECSSFVEKLAFSILGPCDEPPALCHLLRALFPAVFSDRAGFQAALNNVYVYGTRAGLDAAKRVEDVLPDDDTVNQRQIKEFHERYVDFRTVMCRELNPDPRPKC